MFHSIHVFGMYGNVDARPEEWHDIKKEKKALDAQRASSSLLPTLDFYFLFLFFFCF